MTPKNKRNIAATILEVLLCIALTNIDRIVPDGLGKPMNIIVGIGKIAIALLIFFIFYWVVIRPNNNED